MEVERYFFSKYTFVIVLDAYDLVVSSGTFVAGHMKSDCLIELCNVIKSGMYQNSWLFIKFHWHKRKHRVKQNVIMLGQPYPNGQLGISWESL